MTDSRIGMTFHFTPAPQSRDDSQAPRGGLGSQVLPVAELGDDFAGDPEDGSQYLFLVRCAPSAVLESWSRADPSRAPRRREAATHAKVVRVENPYAGSEAASTPVQAAPASRPSAAWREAFVRNFEAARQVNSSLSPRAALAISCGLTLSRSRAAHAHCTDSFHAAR